MAQKSYWATSTPSLGASSTGAACLAGKDTALAQTRQTDRHLPEVLRSSSCAVEGFKDE